VLANNILQQCISRRAEAAIGVSSWNRINGSSTSEIKVGDDADFILFGAKPSESRKMPRARKTVQDLINDAGFCRETVYKGALINSQ